MVTAGATVAARELVLAGFRLRVVAVPAVLDQVTSVLVPACAVASPEPAAVTWTVRVRGVAAGASMAWDDLRGDRPVLAFPRSGPSLVLAEQDGPRLRAYGWYRSGDAPVQVDVDTMRRETAVTAPGGVGRWADWLARMFFASRMLAAGWRMLHASAVEVDGSAVLFLAPQHGGKSTLVHRACAELGAGFLADDLVLVGPDLTVVGWPTRVAIPAGLAPDLGDHPGLHESVAAGLRRTRVVMSPPEHRRATGTRYAPPAPLRAVVCVQSAPGLSVPRAALSVAPASGIGWTSALARACDVPAQRLHVSDPLGLTGRPDIAPVPTPLDDGHPPAGVGAVTLHVADLAHLPTAPVWAELGTLIPWLAAR